MLSDRMHGIIMTWRTSENVVSTSAADSDLEKAKLSTLLPVRCLVHTRVGRGRLVTTFSAAANFRMASWAARAILCVEREEDY